MHRWVIAAWLCLLATAVWAVDQNPIPGYVFTYQGPSLGADWLPLPTQVPNNTTLKGIPGSSSPVFRAGFAAAGDGGGMWYNFSNVNCPAADDGAQVNPTNLTGCWLADFHGATPDFRVWGTDSDSAIPINKALVWQTGAQAPFCIVIPAGNFGTVSTVQMTGAGPTPPCLNASGWGVSTITITSTSLPVIHIGVINLANSGPKIIGGLTLNRVGVATAGANGITVDIGGNWGVIDNVYAINHWDGFSLGSTGGVAWLTNSVAQNNLNNGVTSTNSVGTPNNQWQYFNNLFQGNAGYGLNLTTATGASGTGPGIYNSTVFANTLGGAWLIGKSGAALSDTIINGFTGSSDGNNEIEIDPAGGSNNKISNVFLETAGTTATGPTLSTPASHVGQGILIGGAVASGSFQLTDIKCYADSAACLGVTPGVTVQSDGLFSELDNANVSGAAINITNGSANFIATNIVTTAGANGTYGLTSAGFVQQTNANYFGGSSGGCHFTGSGSTQSTNTVGTGCGTIPSGFTTVLSCSAGAAPTISSQTSTYIREGNKVIVSIGFITSNTGCVAGVLRATLPFATAASIPAGFGGADAASGKTLAVWALGGTTTLNINLYDGTNAAAATLSVNINGTYFISGQ